MLENEKIMEDLRIYFSRYKIADRCVKGATLATKAIKINILMNI